MMLMRCSSWGDVRRIESICRPFVKGQPRAKAPAKFTGRMDMTAILSYLKTI